MFDPEKTITQGVVKEFELHQSALLAVVNGDK